MIDKQSKETFRIQLQKILKKQIREGSLKAGQKIPSERDLSELYSVSRTTAKNAVLDLLNEGLVVRASGKGTFISSKINLDSIKRKRTYTIGFVLNQSKDTSNSVFQSGVYYYLSQDIQDEIKKHNYYLIVSRVDDSDIEDMELFKNLLHKVDGLILAEIKNNNLLRHINAAGIPAVTIFPFTNNYDADSVNIDNFDIGMKAVNYLLSLGHKKIGIINGPLTVLSAKDRFSGYKQALANAKIEFDESLIVDGVGWHIENGENSMEELLKRKTGMTALFAANDLLAKGAIKAGLKQDISFPEDCSIIGCDNIKEDQQTDPSLTSFSIHEDFIARSAVRILMNRIDFPEEPVMHAMYNADMIIRDSCSRLQDSL